MLAGARWEDPRSNIVNVKLVVGRRVQISHKPIRGREGIWK